MKKKLEAELISIAHRILQLKNKSDLVQLHQETQKLYEKLSILRFVEEHFEGARPTIGRAETEQKIETLFDAPTETAVDDQPSKSKKTGGGKSKEPENPLEIADNNIEFADEPTQQAVAETPESPAEEIVPEIEKDVVEPVEASLEPQSESVEEVLEMSPAEDVNVSEPVESNEPEKEILAEEEVIAESPKNTSENIYDAEVKAIEAIAKSNDSFFKPSFELAFDAKEDSETPKVDEKPSAPIVFEDFLGKNYVDPVFVKPEELNVTTDNKSEREAVPITRNFSDNSQVIPLKSDNDSNTQTLNDRISKGITIGLNDRIAFMKHLFNNSSEDYNRVLSQLITFDSLSEATNFIDTMVKPDYNNWEGKDEYSQRFMEIIEKKFA